MGTEVIFKDELSIRDTIAISAMQGLCASDKIFLNEGQLAKRAYEIAYAMLKQREL